MKFSVIGIQNAAIGYVCLWATAPVLAYGDTYRWAAAGAVALWALLEAGRPRGIILNPTLPSILAAFYALYTGITELLIGPDRNIDTHIQLWIILFFVIFYESRRNLVYTMAPIFWLMVATLPIWLYTTYTAFDKYGSHTARHLVRSSDISRELTSEGVGGYSLVYSAVIMIPICISLLVNRKRLIGRRIEGLADIFGQSRSFAMFFVALTLALSIVVVLRAGYSIALILAIACAITSLLFRRGGAAPLMFAPLILMGGYLFIEMSLVPILTALQPLVQGTPYAIKVRDIILTLATDQSQGSFDDRWSRYSRSFIIFLENPLFGVISYRDVGKHSSYLDALARYGIAVGPLLMYIFLYLPARMIRASKDNIGLPLSVFVVAAIFPLLNNVFSAFGVMLFIMAPVACGLVALSPVRRQGSYRRAAAFRQSEIANEGRR